MRLPTRGFRASGLWAIAVLVCAGSRAAHAQTGTQALLPNALRSALDRLYGAAASGDSAALRPWLADDLVWVVGATGAPATKAQILAASGRPPALPTRFDVDSVRVRRVGDVALVTSRRTDRRTLSAGVGGYTSVATWRVLDVFARRTGRLQLVHHTQTWLVAPVTPVALDSGAQQAFVGRYAVAPGIVDSVHWTGGALWATVTGFAPGGRLVPVGASVFSPDGTGALIAFERDAAGRVTGYVQGYPDGRVLRRPKRP